MSTITVEQRLPIFILALSRVPTYMHFLASVLAILIFSVRPSLAPKMPVRKTVPEVRTYKHSNSSTTSTLIDHESDNADESDTSEGLSGELGEAPIKSHNPFSKLAAPVKSAMSPTLARVRPYARRMSLPARRFTEHFATAISTPFHHRRSLDVETDDYFAHHDLPKVMMESKVEIEVAVVEVEQDTCVPNSEAYIVAFPNKLTKFKRFTKKAKTLLRIRRRS